MAYKPPYTITSKMLDYIGEIMKYIGRLTSGNGLDNKPKLRRSNRIKSIYSSLVIENNVLSEKQVKDIINGKLVVGPKKDILEVKNAIRVYDDILTINPYNLEELLKYHRIMLESLINDNGHYRIHQEGVFDGDQVIHYAPSHELVPELMSNLFDYLNNYDENILIKSCVFHYEIEFIHPFSDGNGRMGRLFQTCLLASKEKIFTYLPIESIIEERQDEYYNVINQSNKNGSSNLFIEFMLDAILETIKRILTSSKDINESVSIQVKRLLIIMQEGIPYTTQEIMKLLKMKSRVSCKKNYINPSMSIGLIKMTIPDKPQSRNQRYIKV